MAVALTACCSSVTQADDHPNGTPSLSSRAGAAYTLYLNFSGFNFTGAWGGLSTPGSTPAYNLPNDDADAFSPTEIANMRVIWTRVAEKYAAFDVNVTTVDPAIAAGRSGTDAARQQFYDASPRLMQTVIGGSGAWYGGGGVSFVNKAQFAYGTSANNGAGSGWHTNFCFAALAPNNLPFVSEASAHELGHALGLNHQGDHFTSSDGTVQEREYSRNGGFTGPGTFSPVMGNSYFVQRGLWRFGRSTATATQNDVRTLCSNSGLSKFVKDPIGHTIATATPLPIDGDAIVAGLATGVIVPTTSATASPLGTSQYTSDYFEFATNGSPLTLTLNAGAQRLGTGVADPGATLSGTLTILDAAGTTLAIGEDSADTLASTFVGTLPAGTYYARVGSNGGFASTFDESAAYYSMGSYFLTGSGFTAVPEPAMAAVFAVGVMLLARRRPAA